MKGRKRRMNGLQKEIENRHLPELMRLENGDAVTNCVDWKLRREEIKKLFEALGIVIELPVHLMGIGGALTGCGPAFVDLIIEALGDAGVKYGVPRKQAYEMVSQMILGSAKLQLETGEHPGVLKDNVCSPAGTTICGVDALEHAGIRAGFIDAIDAIMNK